MSEQYDNSMRGALWDNTHRKRPDKRDPDISGKANINGVEMVVSGWLVQRKGDNQPLYDLSFREANQNPETRVPPHQQNQSAPMPGPDPVRQINDDIPFG